VAALEYVVTDEATHLFVLAREAGQLRLDHFPLPGAEGKALQIAAARLRERLASRDLSVLEDARRLHRLLLGPARQRLKGKTHLVIVPDRALWEVPFQALQDGDGRYVVESAAVSYAPSLTVLRDTRPARRQGGPRTVLAMGKAEFGSRMSALPDAERQARLVAALYGADRSSRFLGPEAREDRFKAEAPRYDVLHLATHGVLEAASPLYSHLVLTPSPDAKADDGLLEAWEVLGLELDADLAVLSACETGRGHIAPGEGVVGTMWAFFVAGARALLVSQWKVDAASTTDLMTGLHRRLAPGRESPAEALRQASLEVLRQPRYSHPFYWAGFALVGKPY